MKYSEIDWDRLIPESTAEQRAEEDRAGREWLEELIGDDLSKCYPLGAGTLQGEGNGVYALIPEQHIVYNKIRKEVEYLNNKCGGSIFSGPHDPSGDNTILTSRAKYYRFDDISRFENLIRLSGEVDFMASPGNLVRFSVATGKLYNKILGADIYKNSKTIDFSQHEDIREKPYTVLNDASAEEIFFNDVGLKYEPNLYDLNKVRDIAIIKDYFDYLTDADYDFDEIDIGRGGVDNIVFDEKTNVAYMRCFIDEVCIQVEDHPLNGNACKFDEVMPVLRRADSICFASAYENDHAAYMWAMFAVAGIKKNKSVQNHISALPRG